jgi:type II secretory pathway component GspD/PulD (secretin)
MEVAAAGWVASRLRLSELFMQFMCAFRAPLLRGLAAAVCVAFLGIMACDAFGQQGAATSPATPAKEAVRKEAIAKPPATSMAAARPAAPAEGKLTFSFRYQPWQDVLDWFAQQAGLSLLMESPPPGTFNYTDSRSYSVAEALDVLNGVLLTKGYTLVRKGRMLVVVNLEDGVPPNLVSDVPLSELDQKGEYELIRVLFPVWNMSPEQAAAEVQPLLGPQGKVVILPQARQIQVTETGGRLRTIRSIVNAVEQPEMGAAGMREFPLKYLSFEAAMPTIRQMLVIPAEAFSTPDGSVQITRSATQGKDGAGEKLLFRGTAQQAARLAEILRLIDVPEAARGVNGAPQMEVYSVTNSDPEVVVKMLQTLLRDPSVVLTSDKEAGQVIAFATPPQQATIRATIDQMQKDSRQVAVIGLANVDPQYAVVSINKLFGSHDDKPDPKAPRVDADLTTRSLLVRGTASQVAQIKDLLRQMGETEDVGNTKSQQHVRLLPLTGAAARSAIGQIEQIWPSVRTNAIRVVTPSTTIPTYRPSDLGGNLAPQAPAAAPADDSTQQVQELWQSFLRDRGDSVPPSQPAKPAGAEPKNDFGTDRGAKNDAPNKFRLIANDVEPAPGQSPAKAAPAQKPQPSAGRGAPIVVAPGPGGTLIASDDLEALDQLEDLLTTVAGHNSASGREYRFYVLKYSKAQVIAELLNAIFGGSSAGKDRGIIGDLASNALGDVGGGLMGDLLLGGGGSSAAFSSGAVDIVPDVRLNYLIVHAKPADLDTIEQLLKVLDQRSGPENVEAEAQPRPIPVYNTTAADMAQIVQQLYQDRMAGPGTVMSPQEMMKMIRGGGSNVDQQIQKMTIAIDSRNNILVVRAPDQLFNEVKAMVTELDQSFADSPQTTKVVSLQHSNTAAVQRALVSMLPNVKSSVTPAQGPSPIAPTAQSSSSNDDDSPEERMRRAMRRNWDMVQEMRRMQERSGGGDGDRGGFDRSRFFGRGGPDGFRGRGDGDRGDRGGDRGRDGRRD